ncbi:polymeric immunoglobulin receptor-like isoform X2, partial [Silurus meridionalis]
VTGYSGGGVLIKCKYDTEYTQNLKYFCKGSSPGCSDLIKTGDKNMWVTSGRFSLFDDTKSAKSEFSVMIRELTVEDTGTYQCGVEISQEKYIYTPVELKVKEDVSFEKTINKTVHVRGDVNISCTYPESHKNDNKFLCKRHTTAACLYMATIKEDVSVGKFSLYDDREKHVFTVSLNDVTEQDSGEYWCGAVAWKQDHEYNVYFIHINLTVTGLLRWIFGVLLDGRASMEVTGYSGGEVLIKCMYDPEFTTNKKYFCMLTSLDCEDLINTDAKNMWVTSGRSSMFDDTKSAEFTVKIRELTVKDTGTYQCGVEKEWGTDIYTKVDLNIKKGESLPSVSKKSHL